jgi:hypothetical protein
VKQPEGGLRERLRCSSLFDRPVYLHWKRTMRELASARNAGGVQRSSQGRQLPLRRLTMLLCNRLDRRSIEAMPQRSWG